MGQITVESEGAVGAPVELTYRLIADDAHHQKFLPEAFSNFQVLSGGVGAGTVHSFDIAAGGRVRNYVMDVSEPEPGRVLVEKDRGSSLITTFTVSPDGVGCRVRISTTWQGAGGIGGFFERTFAPKAMRKLYADELTRLDAYARGQAAGAQ
jgi:hypothetical protein